MHPQLLRQLHELAPTFDASSAEARAFLGAVSAAYEKLDRVPDSLLAAINENLGDIVIYRVRHSPAGVMTCDYVSRASEAAIGVTAEKFFGDPSLVFQLIVPEDVPKMRAELARIFHTGDGSALTVRMRHAHTGALRWKQFHSQLTTRLADGTQIRDGIITDVTALKEAEEALRHGRDFFVDLQRATVDLLSQMERPALFRRLGDHAVALLGADYAEISLLEGDELVVHGQAGGPSFAGGARVGRDAAALSWRAVETREPVAVDDYSSHPLARKIYSPQQLRGCAIFPITVGSLCLGVIGLARTASTRAFSPEEIQHGKVFTQMAALVMRNAGIYDEALRLAEAHTKALREKEAHFRFLFENAPDAIFVHDVELGRIVDYNANWLRMFECTDEDMRHHRLGKFAPEFQPDGRNSLEAARAIIARAQAGEVLNYEWTYRTGKGRAITCDVRLARLPSTSRQLLRISAIDITERKNAERAREHLLALTRATLESTADGILVVNAEGRIQTHNHTFTVMWRLPEEVVESGDDERALECVLNQLADPEKFLEKVRALYAEPLAESFDTLHFKDGRVFERYSRPQVFEGEAVGRVWSFRDVTARVQNEQALTQAHRRASLLAQLGRELAEAASPTAASRAVLDAAQQMLGWDCAWLRVVDPADGQWTDLAVFDLVEGERRPITSNVSSMNQSIPLLKRVIDEGAQLVLREHAEEESQGLRLCGNGRRSLSLMFAPIRREGQLVGLLSLQSYRHHAYDAAALELTQTLAHQCAGALARLQTRAALGESEARFRLVWENSADGMRLTDATGRIVAVNQSFCRIAGKSQAELLGRPFSEVYVESARAVALARYVDRFAQRTPPAHFERRMTLWDGRVLWFEISTCFIESDSDRPLLLGLFRDITAQKNAEHALAQAHRHASVLAQLGRELAEAASARAAALSILEGARQLLGWDSAWLQVWNEEKQIFEDPVNFDLLDGERREVPSNPIALREPSPAVRTAMRDGAFLHLRQHESDGISDSHLYGTSRRSLSRMFVPIRRGGRLLGVISIQSYTANAYDRAALDLLQTLADHCAGALVRIQAHTALGETEERFRLVWERTADGMRLTDPAGQVVAVNDAYCAMVGQPRAAIEGQLLCAPFAAADHDRIVTRYRERIARRELRTHEEVEAGLADGRAIWVEVSDCFIETDPAHPLLLGIFRDISARVGAVAERTRLEESLRQAQKMESLGTLAGGIAHDFNNILTGMFGFLELARYDLPPQHPAQEWLRQVMDSGHRAKELVRQILTFSRNQPGARAPLQLHRIIGEAVNLLRSTLPAKVDLGARLERGCPAVLADANQIHQIVMNLCTNAWHALPERGGRIFITLEPAVVPADLVPAHPQFAGRSAVCLTVSDNGSGIPPEALPRIFEPFFTTKEVGKGTGLGLAVVHGIVGTHEGAITVQSVVGAGTTFRIFLPALATAASPAPAAIAPSVPAGQGQHILWIDDDVATNIAVERTLTALGYRVTACRHPAAAVEKFSATPREFALVLTDLSMPEMGGDELITIFRRVAPTLPMLVVTGFVQPVEREALLAHGVNEVLHKPLTREELAAAIARHVPTARA